MKVFLRLSCFR